MIRETAPKPSSRFSRWALVLLLSLLSPGACKGGRGEDSERGSPMTVAVSVAPQAYFLRQLGGDRVQVEVLVPAGSSPETWEPSVGALTRLSSAKIWFRVGGPGAGIEKAWSDRVRAVGEQLQVVDCSKGMDFVEGNPHVWLSVRLARLQAETISSALIAADPEGEAQYRERKRSFLSELDALDRELSTILTPVAGRRVLVFHPAWVYFARDYGLRLMAVEEHGHEPGAGSLSHLLEHAREAGLKDVFVQPQLPSPSAETLARSLGGVTVAVDPLSERWPDSLREAARAFRKYAR